MVRFNPLYAAYMPCRVSLVEDTDHKLWLTMINLDFLIENVPLPEDLRTIAININAQNVVCIHIDVTNINIGIANIRVLSISTRNQECPINQHRQK